MNYESIIRVSPVSSCYNESQLKNIRKALDEIQEKRLKDDFMSRSRGGKVGCKSKSLPEQPKITNREFAATNSAFINWCEVVGLEPTARQASKYRQGKGLAFKYKRHKSKYLKRQVAVNKEKRGA